jgi:uncharacterized protein YidB (DUF937 family)
MGLLDVLNGMRNGPSGQRSPSSSGGMSPITMGVLALLAYKGIKHLSSSTQAPRSEESTGSGGLGGYLNGGLGGLLNGGLGGLLAGGASGSVLSNGLGSLLRQFQENGQGQVASSWVGTGPNQDISEQDLAKSLGSEDIDALSQHTGMPHDQVLATLRRELPNVVDELTPQGRVPAPHEF